MGGGAYPSHLGPEHHYPQWRSFGFAPFPVLAVLTLTAAQPQSHRYWSYRFSRNCRRKRLIFFKTQWARRCISRNLIKLNSTENAKLVFGLPPQLFLDYGYYNAAKIRHNNSGYKNTYRRCQSVSPMLFSLAIFCIKSLPRFTGIPLNGWLVMCQAAQTLNNIMLREAAPKKPLFLASLPVGSASSRMLPPVKNRMGPNPKRYLRMPPPWKRANMQQKFRS